MYGGPDQQPDAEMSAARTDQPRLIAPIGTPPLILQLRQSEQLRSSTFPVLAHGS